MRWPPAAAAEVVRGSNKPSTEMKLPDSIDHDTSRKRIFRVGNPPSELQSPRLTRSLADGLLSVTGEDMGKTARRNRAEIGGVSPYVDRHIANLFMPAVAVAAFLDTDRRTLLLALGGNK